MKFSNSTLATITVLSPNHSGQRTKAIDRITPHCVVGQLSAANVASGFANKSRQASSNYIIGKDGEICLCVPESNRSWCTSSAENDQRAITIECASDNTEPYAFKDIVYNKLVDMCEDICRRNMKNRLIWIEDKTKALAYQPKADEMQLTVHRWYANKSCPGNWMFARMGKLADEVNNRLAGTVAKVEKPVETPVKNDPYSKLPAIWRAAGGEAIFAEPPKAKMTCPTGSYTIVETAMGADGLEYGKLKSGLGWVVIK